MSTYKPFDNEHIVLRYLHESDFTGMFPTCENRSVISDHGAASSRYSAHSATTVATAAGIAIVFSWIA